MSFQSANSNCKSQEISNNKVLPAEDLWKNTLKWMILILRIHRCWMAFQIYVINQESRVHRSALALVKTQPLTASHLRDQAPV